MVQAGVHYGLRARAHCSSRAEEKSLSREELGLPAATANIAAGLRPGVMTKAELLRFRGTQADYLEARCSPL